jgi:2-phosphosulfolactate phosphatase
VAAAVNLSLAGARAREILAERKELVILCAGKEAQFGLDDAYTAGRLLLLAQSGSRRRKGLNDGALAAVDLVRRYGVRWERPLTLSAAGRQLAALGRRDDMTDAARQDAYPVLPMLRDRRITAEAG